MDVIITTDLPITVTVTCDKPNILEVVIAEAIQVTVSLLKDGQDGQDGQDAINNTLELVRALNPTIQGNIDANGNTIVNIRNAIANQDPISKAQADANLAEAKAYADTVSAETVRWAGFWDASIGTYPTGSGIKRGDEYEISTAGTIGTIDFEVGDVLRARINTPGQTIGNWSVGQGNVQQSNESRQGTAKIATAETASNENTTNDADIITGKKLWLNFWQRVLAMAWTWTLKQTFTTAPRFLSVTASQYLKVDASKDIIGVNSIPVSDINGINVYEKYIHKDSLDKIISLSGEKAFAYYLIPANTYQVGSKIQIDWNMIKTIVGNNGQISTLKHSTSNLSVAGTSLSLINSAATVREIRMKVEIILRPSNVANILYQDTSILGQASSTVLAGSFTFNPSIDNYFFATTNPNNNNDIFTQIWLSVKGFL